MRALAVAAALLVLAAAAPVAAQAPAPTKEPGVLTVGLAMPAAGFQVGAVRGREVVLAKGLEIELARAIARELGLPRVRFLNEALFSRLLAAGPKDWDLALAEVTITPARARRVDFSAPYLRADQAVLVRKGLDPPASVAALRALRLCSERATTGAQLIVERIRPARPPLLVLDPSQLQRELFRGRCDAAVYDAPVLGAVRAQAPDRFGPLAGRIVTGERYGAVFEQGSALAGPVNRAIRRLVADGTVERLQKRWLSADISGLKTLPDR